MESHPQAQCAPARSPVVVMTRAEASALFDAIDHARISLVQRIGKIDRSRVNSDAVKVRAVAPLRADLATLAAFAEALGTAHNLGGY